MIDQERRVVVLASLFPVMFCVALAVSWWARPEPRIAPGTPARTAVPLPVAAQTPSDGPARIGSDPIAELQRRTLRLPIAGARVDAMRGGFAERRNGNRRPHEAVDILAPRHTPVVAVEDGTIARLFLSKAGGITVYQFDPTKQFCYYYAHLDRYADGLRENQPVSAGDVIGYVGTTGNAPANTPHLHFAIFKLGGDARWWEGTSIDPYLVFSGNRPAGISER